MDLFRTECKSRLVLVLLLLCGWEDMRLFPSLWVMKRKTEDTAGQGWRPKAMRRLNNIIRSRGCSTGSGISWRQQGQDTESEWVRRAEQNSVWKMINRARCWARRGKCSSEHLMADKANYYSQKNRTIHSGEFHSKLHPTMHVGNIWHKQILNSFPIATMTALHMWVVMCKKKA